MFALLLPDPADDTSTYSWSEWVDAIAFASSDDLAHDLCEEFARAVDGDLNRIAGFVIQKRRISFDSSTFDNVRAVVDLEFATMLVEIRAGNFTGITNPRALLRSRVAYSSRAFNEIREGSTGSLISGTKNALRRRHEVNRTRAELLAATGIEPDDDTLIAAANARLGATRSDVIKQGMVITHDDLIPLPTSDELNPEITPAPGDDDAAIDSTMRKEIARLVLDHPVANSTDQRRRIAAFLWKPQLADNPLPPPARRDLPAAFPEYTPDQLRRLYRLLMQDIPRQILIEKYGIASL